MGVKGDARERRDGARMEIGIIGLRGETWDNEGKRSMVRGKRIVVRDKERVGGVGVR